MGGFVYILANRKHGTLYVGVTNDLARRVFEHRQGQGDGFSARYGVCRLVYYEPFDDITDAIMREKRMKRWPRAWKVQAIEKENPEWLDLYDTMNL